MHANEPGRRWIAVGAERTHKEEVAKRLANIEGQVSGIRGMFEADRYCVDVLDQISAARAGLEAIALLILDDHVNGCVTDALNMGDGAEKQAEMLAAVRRLVGSN
jgi:DNA-binding FrmR family transcriptional regulator